MHFPIIFKPFNIKLELDGQFQLLHVAWYVAHIGRSFANLYSTKMFWGSFAKFRPDKKPAADDFNIAHF